MTLLCAKQAAETAAGTGRPRPSATDPRAAATDTGRVRLCLPCHSASPQNFGRGGGAGKMNGEDNISSSFACQGVSRTHTEMPYKKPKELRVARTRPISQFTPGKMGTRHTKFRNDKKMQPTYETKALKGMGILKDFHRVLALVSHWNVTSSCRDIRPAQTQLTCAK